MAFSRTIFAMRPGWPRTAPVLEQAATLARWIGPLSIDQVAELKVSLAALVEQHAPS
jgi:hypothetical protein